MINAGQDLINYDGDHWEEYLNERCLFDIFKELIIAYADQPGIIKCLIRYIVWTYSRDSDKVVIGDDWVGNKKRIYEAADLPPTEQMEQNVIYLKDDIILRTVHKWLNFQDDDTLKELSMLKELRSEMQISANLAISNGNGGGVNYDQKFKNAKYSIELSEMIKKSEQKLLQSNPHMKAAIQEVKKMTKNKITIGPENFAK